MIKLEHNYICLSEKDKRELKEWQNRNKKPKPTKKIKKANKTKKPSRLDEIAKSLKGKPYSVFLKSEYWQIIRQMVLKRDDFKCLCCGDDKYLQVHHENYKIFLKEHKNLKFLHTLCRKCHYEHHCAQD